MLVEDKVMSEMYLKHPAVLGQPVFFYSACKLFTKNEERIQNIQNSKYIYPNELVKACF